MGLEPHPNSFLISKSLFCKIGMFDKSLRGNYGSEDREFFLRAEKASVPSRLAETFLEVAPSDKFDLASRKSSLDRATEANKVLLDRKKSSGRGELRLTSRVESLFVRNRFTPEP